MGYTKIIQYGNITEIFQYEKALTDNPRKHVSALTRKRQKQARIQRKLKGNYERSKQSVKRSKENFFRLCHHNNVNADTINFVTLTFAYDAPLKTASRHVAHFMERVKKSFPEISLSYISVPELTKKGRIHFHLLVYGLPSETADVERKTRNFQRLFQRGYVDIMRAEWTSAGIAGYMAKYMAKAIGTKEFGATRGYTCSQNIKKITSAGSNTLSGYADLIVPTENVVNIENRSYDVPYLGTCSVTKITTKI